MKLDVDVLKVHTHIQNFHSFNFYMLNCNTFTRRLRKWYLI